MFPFGWAELLSSIHFLLRVGCKTFLMSDMKDVSDLNVCQWVSLQLFFLPVSPESAKVYLYSMTPDDPS